MTAPMNDGLPLSKMAQPLSVGNVVNVGLQIYRNNAKSYLSIALQATLWVLVPILLGLVAGVILVALQVDTGVIVLLAIAWTVLLFYCLARFLADSALISRLAFTTLLNQPESPAEAGRHTTRRKWQFLWLYVLLLLLFTGVLIGVSIATGILITLVMGVAGVSMATAGSFGTGLAWIVAFVLYVAVILGILLVFLWLGLRLYFLSEIPLAVEPDLTPGGAIGRSWMLTRGSFWRLFWVSSVLGLMILPIQMLQQLASATLQGMITIVTDPLSSAFSVLTFFVTIAVSLLLGILLLPLWQSVEATLYYDLRSRREGLAIPTAPQDRAGSDSQGDRAPSEVSVSPLRWLKTASIVTPERVELQFVLAGIGGRGFAMMVDLAILLGVWALGAVLYTVISLQLLDYLSNTGASYAQLPTWLVAIAFLASFILFAGYFAFFEVMWQGQTPGKRVAQIRVIRDDGRPVGLAQAVLRSLLLAFDGVPLFLGIFFILFEKREKRLGDILAGTLVVQEEKPIAKTTIILSDRAQQLAHDLPQTTTLVALRPDEFATIREYLERRSQMDREARRDLSLNLARQMRSRIEMETIPTGLTSDDFLEAIYVAYQTLK